MKKILIIGGTGYLGAKFSDYLNKQGFEVLATCRKINDDIVSSFKGITLIEVDFLNPLSIIKLSEINDVHTVIHTVSLDQRQCDKSSISDIVNVNFQPTWLLLDIFTKKQVSKFIYLSTTQVLGKTDSEIITEDEKVNPLNIYGVSHLICENLVNYYNESSSTHCMSVRLTNGYGAPVLHNNNCWRLVVNDLCRMAYYDNVIVLQSDGSGLRDFLHISDTANVIEILINNSTSKRSLFNISNENVISIYELAFLIKEVFDSRFNKNIPVIINGEESVYSNQRSFQKKIIIKSDKIKELGFKPKVDLEKGIQELITYFENND